MELRHKREIKDSLGVERETEKRDRWYNKLWDVAANIGKGVAKVACIVSVPVIVASCTCSRIELVGDAHSRPDVADVSHEDAPDVHDAVEEDVTHEDIIGEDTLEEELPPVCDDLLERGQINNLIGDELNRRVDDRVSNEVENIDAEYSLLVAEVSDNANPFSDGMDGSIGPTETFMYRITGTTFTPLASSTVVDDNVAMTYNESQNIWIRGSSYYDDPLADVVGDVRFVAYTMKFKGATDDFGIPVCTESVGGDYTYCKSGAEDADYEYATEAHRVAVQFMGKQWCITEMVPPVIEVNNKIKVQNGGYVKLGKEAVSSHLDIGGEIVIDGLRFVLTDAEEHNGTCFAIISVFDEAGNELKREKVEPGETKEFYIDGEVYRIHAWDTVTCEEAYISILSDEIKIEDGQKLDPDTDRFNGWYSVVGWKNKNATAILANPNPDHLRTISIYADDVADVSSSGEEKLLRGEGITFPTDNFEICYGGLDITDEERSELRFSFSNAAIYILPHVGPVDPETGEHVGCSIHPNFMSISSEIPLVASLDSSVRGSVALIALNGAECEGSIGSLAPGSLFMREDLSDPYKFVEYEGGVILDMMDSSDHTIGGIGWSRWEDAGITSPENWTPQPEYIFMVSEDAGAGKDDLLMFAYKDGSFNLEVTNIETGEYMFRENRTTYRGASPVYTSINPEPVAEEGYITDRGSVFASIDDTQVVYYIADRVAYSVYYIGVKEE